jgi:hypothetical protein
MAHIVQCIEPDRLPIEIKLEVRDGEKFCVFLLPNTSRRPGDTGASSGSLRSTILLRSETDPPPEASLVFEVSIYDPGTGDPVTMRTQRLGSSVNTDYVRPHVRSRVTPGMELRSGSRLEVILLDLRRVTFTLQLEEEISSRASRAIGGGGVRHKQPKAGGDTAYFLYNTARSVLTINLQYLIARATSALTKLGIPPWIIPLAITAILVVGGLAYFAYTQAQAANEAEEMAAASEEARAQAEASASISLENELTCLAQTQDLAQRLQLRDLGNKAMIRETLGFTFTNSVVLGEGGAQYGDSDVISFDKEQQDALIEAIFVKFENLSGAAEDASICLGQASVLEPDLPVYTLLWHPDPEFVCPSDYAAVDDGIDRVGRFGLSMRVKRQYGGIERDQQLAQASGDDGVNTDARMAVRWAAEKHALGLREVQTALFAADTGNRVAVAPSQGHLWVLTLWDAYNRMPSPADGALDNPVGMCITEMMQQVGRQARPAEPGAPLLPNLVEVALGDEKIRLSPTPGCPWPDGAIQKGAQQAILAVAHTTKALSEGSNQN